MHGKVSPARFAIHWRREAAPSWHSQWGRFLLFFAVVALSLTLASCGGTSSSSTPAESQPPSTGPATAATGSISKAALATKATTKQVAAKPEHAPIDENVLIRSTAFSPAGELPARYTCDGANSPPPLHWSGVPAGTAELSLFLIKVAPVNGHLTINWAVAGIDPKSHGIEGSKLPAGSVVGLNSEGHAGYDLCPPKGTNEEYVYVLMSLPHSQHPKPNFNAAAQRLLDLHNADYQGFLVFTYPRH